MQGDFFAILQLRPGRYEKEAIDRQYRSVRQEILRAGGPDRQRRLDDALIARFVLANSGQQASLLRRHLAAIRAHPPRRPAVIAARPAARPARQTQPPTREQTADVFGRFARMVAEHLEDGLLRFTARQRLLQLAKGLGIAPFKANLVIAEVLHEQQIPNPKSQIPNKSQAPSSKPLDEGPLRAPRAEHYGLRLIIALLLAAAGGLTLTFWFVR